MINTLEVKEHINYQYEELCNIIKTENINSVFQPIVSLYDATVIGYEALSRGPENSSMQSPEVLLNIAKEYDKLWELEELFRSKALESIYNKKIDVKIFLNINPIIMNSMRFKDSFTKEYLRKYCLGVENIIFEVTEKEMISDRESFRITIEDCKNDNYKIAIDDFGAGYSGFGRIYDIKPHYIKLDMDIVRDIDKDNTKQAIVKSIYEFSRLSGCKLVGEGIETEEELKTLINIGVQYGQGYFIQKPHKDIMPIRQEVINIIRNQNDDEISEVGYNISNVYISSIAKKVDTIHTDTLVRDVDNILKKNKIY
ncbi:EAL domain-containing protein [Clostridium cylindrosporum]|uniref:Diguanylate cyclase/phosphodiesterase n=1 Tax=Clostridium cylindrosporum DSM 605 TaxID=1121307 RepID=A0A0J8D8B6_CLOCY|nr:EAL domain-containing protein [Clostridium cylindrosporum]KMT22300.1 diguanylate cyclase/phosphodiesterase [Clostridium cylindrosporum DSM 605]